MKRYYPVLLDVEGRPCLVVGGSQVAEEKVRGLLESGARVTLLAPRATPTLTRWARSGRIAWLRRRYRPGDLAGFVLVVAATDGSEVNRQVWTEAQHRGIWLNAVDDPPHCSFILPAVYRQGDLLVAISTGGTSPALAARLRDRLGAGLGPEYALWLQLLGQLRPEVTRRIPDPEARKRLWYRIVDSDGLERVRKGDVQGALAVARALIDQEEAQGSGATP